MALTNKQIIQKVNEAFDKADIEAFLSLCSEDIVWTMLGDEKWSGKETIRNAMKGMDSNPPDFTTKEMIAEGDTVVAYGDMKMKNKEGGTNYYSFCDVYYFEGGLIKELNTFMVKQKDSNIIK